MEIERNRGVGKKRKVLSVRLFAKALAAAVLCAALAASAPLVALASAAAPSAPAKQLLAQMKQSAAKGLAVGVPFAVETTTIDAVEKKWGKPDSSAYIASAKGTYNAYAKHAAAFGFNKGEQIFEARSLSPSLGAAKLSDVRAVYGKPAYTRLTTTQLILGYVASAKYRMLLVFARPAAKTSDPKLAHYSVFYPAGTVNYMADDPGRQW